MLPGEVLQGIGLSIVRAAANEIVREDSYTEHVQFASAAVSTSITEVFCNLVGQLLVL